LDGTLLGNPDAAWRFTQAWAAIEPQRRPLLVFNTSRTTAETRALVTARALPEPDFIIGCVGTELHDSLYNRGAEFRRQFSEGWDLARVQEIVAAMPGVRAQPGEFTGDLKSSWIWSGARREQLDTLKQRLADAGLKVTVIYSCLHFLDIVPARAGKGSALNWLCQRLGVPLEHVLVAGDTGNDGSMFLLPNVRGIVVANALPELFTVVAGRRMFVSTQSFADGVLEGLAKFGVIRGETAIGKSSPMSAT
jgi:sucrose-6F-phosphate phosphohydrolase